NRRRDHGPPGESPRLARPRGAARAPPILSMSPTPCDGPETAGLVDGNRPGACDAERDDPDLRDPGRSTWSARPRGAFTGSLASGLLFDAAVTRREPPWVSWEQR